MKMKKLLAMVLCVAMVLGTMGTVVFAEESVTETTFVAQIGNQKFTTVMEALVEAAKSNDDVEIKLLQDSTELLTNDFEFIVNANVKFTAETPVTAAFYNQGTKYDIVFGSTNNNTITIGENVTFKVKDRNIWLGYYGDKHAKVEVYGTLSAGYQLWNGADTDVYGTIESLGEALVIRRGRTLTVDGGNVKANYFSILSGNIYAKNGANVECGPVWINNSGNYTLEGNVEIVLDNATLTSTGDLKSSSTHTDGVSITIKDNSTASFTGNEISDNTNLVVCGKAAQLNLKSLNNEGTIKIFDGGNLTASNVTNNGVIEFKGECSVNIESLTGETLYFLDGAIIKDSTVGGDVFVAGNVTFRGDNTFAMLYDYGTLTDYYGTTANMEWTVEAGSSVKLTNTARYGLGYGDKITVNGNITNALAARGTLTDDDLSLFMHGLVGQESSGWNQQSYLNVSNAYVIIGNNNSFGNKPGNYGGTYTYNINNSVVDASRITFYEALSKTTFNITNSDVKMGTFMTRDADSVFTLTDSKVVSTATSNGTDEGNYNAGTLKLVNSDLRYSAPVTNTGVLTVDTNSSFTAPSITGAGKIEIDVSNYDGYADLSNIINADLTGFTGEVKAVGGNGADVKFVNGQLVVEANPTGGPISGYTGEDGIWGDTKANSKESYIIKIYSGDTFMGQSELNPTKGLIDGNVHVTWSIKLDAASNTDDHWIMSWAIAPSMDCQPTHVALEVDGVEVSRSAIQLNGPDSINKIHAAITDENGKILSYATSLQNAFGKVKDGETIELLRDVVLDGTVNYSKNVAFTIDGNGKSIKTSNGFVSSAANAVLDISGDADVTFENVVFDGIKKSAAICTVNADIAIDNCVFKNCNHTVDQGLLRLLGDATITNSKFVDNTCTMVITLCYDASNGDKIYVIDNCLFQNNTVSGPTVVYYADGAKCTVNDSEFIGNKVNTTGNAATLYMGINDGITVTGNLFKDNTVTTTHATTKRVAGGVFAGYDSVEGTITNNVFVNNTATGGAAPANSAVYSAASGVAGNLDGNYWDGREPVPGVDFDHESPSQADLTLENYYGEYTLDADGNVVLSDAKPVNAKSVSVNFVLNTEKSNADESYLVYDIVINSRDGHVINRLNTADLTFEISSSKVAYEITPADKITLTTDLAYPNRYMFNFKGKDNVEDTATSLKIGEVKLTGYDTFTFGVANETTNLVTATTVDDNIVDEFKGTGLVVSDVISTTIEVPVRTLTINIDFPNAIRDNKLAYQDMKVEITGTIDGVQKTVTHNLGKGEWEMNEEGSYVVTEDNLVLNNAYTVTVSGAGYRTARYTVTMTEDKALKFWNNVMDEAQVVEIGKDSSAVNVTFLAGDIVKDNKINIYDLSAVVSYFGQTNDTLSYSDYAKYDLNRDGVIDSKDVAYVLVSWNN